MSILRSLYALMAIFIFAAFSFVSPILAGNDHETAFLAITAAENAIISAYEAVLEVEQVGGNISGLFARLNKAGELLAAARMSYKNGDFGNATQFANLSRNVGEEVKEAAYPLRDLAWNKGVQQVMFTMMGSISSIILIVLGSLWVWRFLKKRYQ